MSEHETYKAAFSRVKAPANAAQKALARLEQESAPHAAPRRRQRRRVFAVLALAALLTVTAWAEIANGAVSNMLAPLYGGAQTELVDHIGRPVNARASNGGYTITADAVIGDRSTVYVVYTLRRDDGGAVPECLHFAEWDNSIAAGTGSNSRESIPGEDNTTARFLEEWSGTVPVVGRNATVTLTDLVQFDPATETDTLIAKGTWTLRFALRYEDTTETLPIDGLTVTDTDGRAYTIQSLRLSALGVSADMTTEPFSVDCTIDPLRTLPVRVRLKDGTEASFRTMNAGSSSSGRVDYAVQFQVPAPRDTIAAILIGDTEIPVAGG